MEKITPPRGGQEESELEAQTKLHAARQVCAAGMQKAGRSYVIYRVAVYADRISRGAGWPRAVHARVYPVVLRMVEEVESLPAEVECASFAEGEALEEAEVKVDAARIGERIAATVAEGQTRWRFVRTGIVEQWPTDARNIGYVRAVRVTSEVRARPGTDVVGNPARVAEVGSIGNTEGCAGLRNSNA